MHPVAPYTGPQRSHTHKPFPSFRPRRGTYTPRSVHHCQRLNLHPQRPRHARKKVHRYSSPANYSIKSRPTLHCSSHTYTLNDLKHAQRLFENCQICHSFILVLFLLNSKQFTHPLQISSAQCVRRVSGLYSRVRAALNRLTLEEAERSTGSSQSSPTTRPSALTSLVSKVDEETAENAVVDLRVDEHTHARQCPHTATYPVNNLQSLALGNLGTLQSLVEPVQRLGVEGLGAGDDDLELTPVGSHERVEVGKDLGGRSETAVLGEDGEEVGEDGGGARGDDG